MSEPRVQRNETSAVLARRELANAIRALSMDAVQAANSGHPGAPMGMADIAEVLWRDFLVHNPANPAWPNRDRFVLSNGHGSMLLYSLLHLSGYALSTDDLKAFRQLHSKTPGHPERGDTPGVETTTGPLGQGLANGVGMALAERQLAARFNRPGHELVDHYTYVFVGDGCLMEGISHEACSLAGTLGLGKLIVCYDDNGISIDGEVAGWFTDDTPARFAAYGWQVIPAVDGHDATAIKAALTHARAETTRPTLICCKTVIGFGSPNKAGKESCHGAALGAEEVAATRLALGWPHAPFFIPDTIYAAWNARTAGSAHEQAWLQRCAAYRSAHPALAAEFERVTLGRLPANWQTEAENSVAALAATTKPEATRKSSERALDYFGKLLPELFGGSADLTGSNYTFHASSRTLSGEQMDGNYVSYGVREFAMAAIMNGLALHGGAIPFGGTFLVFSDYSRNGVRMAALMGLRVIHVFTHDSIGVGEDGPTHQPIEHVSSLRLIPNLDVWRPADAAETAVAWRAAIEREQGPSCLSLSRQNLPQQPRSAAQRAAIARGAYVLLDSERAPSAIVMATGSEVALAMDVVTTLQAEGHAVCLVSMPCQEAFDRQDKSYRDSVLPPTVRTRVAIEAGSTACWYRYVGLDGLVIGLDGFGASAPLAALLDHFELTAVQATAAVRALLARV